MRFTDEQERVIAHAQGHAWVSAVAGSGKTSVLVERIARLLRTGVAADRIVVVQFNKFAQEKFAADLARRLGDRKAPEVRTFHSLGRSMCLRLEAISRLPKAQIKPSTDRIQRAAIRNAWRMEKASSDRPGPDVEAAFIAFVGQVKSQLSPAEDVFNKGDYPLAWKPFIRAFALYEDERIRRRWRTYDDLCWEPVIALQQEPQLWRLFQTYDHLMVDEAQDSNEVQYEMLRGISGNGASVMMVGDVDQTIYEWRGANTNLMLHRFPVDFAPATRYPMTRTFRFGPEVALMATQLITHNQQRDDKIVVAADARKDTRIRQLVQRENGPSGLIEDLKQYQAGGMLHTCLMLSRYTLGTIPYELEMFEAGIPYHFYGRASTFLVPELASMIGALAVATNFWPVEQEQREVFIQSMLAVPSMYVPAEELDRVVDQMVVLSDSDPSRLHEPLVKLAGHLEVRGVRAASNVRDRAQAIELLCSGAMGGQKVDAILGLWSQVVGLDEHLNKSAHQSGDVARGDTSHLVKQFRRLADGFQSATELLDQLGAGACLVKEKPPEGDHLHIRTIHGSKGLEADVVYLAGLVEGQFPAQMGGSEEEERRLAYVAVTRARKELILLHPQDDGLDALNEDLAKQDDHAPAHRRASSYVYDGEIGLSRVVARAMRTGESVEVECRTAEVTSRYLDEAGVAHIRVKGGTRPRSRRRRLTAQDRITPGMHVWTERLGDCEVVRFLYGPVWQVRYGPDGQLAYEALVGAAWVWEEMP